MFYKNLYTILEGESLDRLKQFQNKAYQVIDMMDDRTLSQVFLNIVSKMWDDANLAYNILNGQVNFMNPAIRISLGKSAKSNSILGWNTANSVYVDLENVLDRLISIDSNPLETRGYILMIVCHELAHLDQDIDYIRMKNDESYKNIIEKANHSYCLKFIQQNYNELQKQYGDFTMQYDSMAQAVDFDKFIKYFKRVPSIKNKIYSLVNTIFEGTNLVMNEEFDNKIDNFTCMNENNGMYIIIKQNGNYMNPSTILDSLRYVTDMPEVASRTRMYTSRNNPSLNDLEIIIERRMYPNNNIMSFKR